MISDETFFAWLDGELDGQAADDVAAAVAADPLLSARADRHRALKADLRSAFDPALDAPPPPRFHTADIVSLPARRAFGLPQWAAMAASLAFGLLASPILFAPSPASVESRDGMLVAAGPLGSALDRQLASTDQSGPVRIGMTFRDQGGAICRSFSGAEASGLACRSGLRWRIEGLYAPAEAAQADYRMAAGGDPNLAALIDQRIAGDAFDASAERDAQAKGWR